MVTSTFTMTYLTKFNYKVSSHSEPHGKASRKIRILAFRHCYHTTQSYFEN